MIRIISVEKSFSCQVKNVSLFFCGQLNWIPRWCCCCLPRYSMKKQQPTIYQAIAKQEVNYFLWKKRALTRELQVEELIPDGSELNVCPVCWERKKLSIDFFALIISCWIKKPFLFIKAAIDKNGVFINLKKKLQKKRIRYIRLWIWVLFLYFWFNFKYF